MQDLPSMRSELVVGATSRTTVSAVPSATPRRVNLYPYRTITRPWMSLTEVIRGHARLVSLPGVGHNDMLGSGDRLWNVVNDFLNSSDGTSSSGP